MSRNFCFISAWIPKINPYLIFRNETFGVVILNKLSKRKFFGNIITRNILKFCDGKQTALQIIQKVKKIHKNLSNQELFRFFQELTLSELIICRDLNRGTLNVIKRSSYPYFVSNVTVPLMAPLHVYWEITYRCNLDCKHCYAKNRYEYIKDMGTKKCFEIIDQLAKLKIFEITFSGGEPLLRKDLIKLIKYAHDKNISVLLTTNGVLINKAMAKKLKKAGLQATQVSLDGANAMIHDNFRAVKGSFAAALRGIKNLLAVDIPVVIATIPTMQNIKEIPKILRLAAKLGVQGYRILECKPFGRGKGFNEGLLPLEDYKKLLKLIVIERKKLKNKLFVLLSESFAFSVDKNFKRNTNDPLTDCPAGRSMCAIIPDGRVSPCSYFSFIDVFCGDLKKTSLKKIWRNSKILKQLRQIDFSKREYSKGTCNYCKYFKDCGRGCRALAYAATNRLDGLDPRCFVN